MNRERPRNDQETTKTSAAASKPGVTGLDGITAAIELAQIGKPEHRQTMRIALARLKQRLDVLRHLGARFGARFRCASRQEGGALHDAVDGGLHCVLRLRLIGKPKLTTTRRQSSFGSAKQSAPDRKTG